MLRIDQIQVGMTLGKDLLSPQGRMLLPKGTMLTDKHLRICKVWGVLEAEIEESPQSDIAPQQRTEIDPKIISAAEEVAATLFLHANQDHEAIRELLDIFTQTATQDNNSCYLEAHRKKINRNSLAHTAPDLATAQSCDAMQLVKEETQLASLPDVYARIVEAINNPRSSASYVADIIGKDVSLAARLLKLVNSAFYSFPNRIDTLPRAVTIIGTNQLSTLALGISIISLFKNIAPEVLDLKSFWHHSVACGIASKLLAANFADTSEERCFVAGLLHDVGRLIVLENAPEAAQFVLITAQSQGLPLLEFEKQYWGSDHGMIGAALMRAWKFPSVLEKAVRYHHQPLTGKAPIEAAIVNLADIIVHATIPASSGNHYVPPLAEQTWKLLGLKHSMLFPLCDQLNFMLDQTMRLFFAEEDHD